VLEALGGGFERTITHLDGRNITLKRSKGKIIQSGQSNAPLLVSVTNQFRTC
jgi:hypothetical protein